MSLNSSKKRFSLRKVVEQAERPELSQRLDVATLEKKPKLGPWKRAGFIVGVPLWTFLGFILAQALIQGLYEILVASGVPLGVVSTTILNAAASAVVYALALFIVIGMPWLIKRRPTTREEIGLHKLPRWIDLLWAPAGYIVYLIATSYVSQLAQGFLTFVDYEQVQNTGFSDLVSRPEYILAFLSLVLIAPIAEEILFRGYLLGKLRKYAPLWLSILITSALFGFVHGQWNVGIDVFVLSIVLCLLRVYTGSLWPSIMLHMLKNAVAYYFLFINPTLLSTMG